MSKNKLLKILVIIILVLFFMIGCYTLYKFIIINKIFNKMQEYVYIGNYYMKVTNSEEESGTMEIYYKDGIGKMIMSNDIYSWTDGTEAYLVDEENKKIQTLDMDSSFLISNEYVGSMVPGYSKNIWQKFLLAGKMSTSVKVQKYDTIRYYVITTNENDVKKVIWFKYTDLLPSQAKINVGEYEQTYYYDISFEKVTDEEVKKPNIQEYTFVEEE